MPTSALNATTTAATPFEYQSGPYRAPGIRFGDREPITDGGRVMCGPERAVDYNSSPVIGRDTPLL